MLKMKREEIALVARTLEWVLDATQASDDHRQKMIKVCEKFSVILKTCPDEDIGIGCIEENASSPG